MPVKLTDIHSLPIYPSSTTLRSLPPSQQSTVLDHICSALLFALSLPDEKLSKLSCNDFIASYAKQEATRILNELIFPSGDLETERRPSQEKVIRRRVRTLAMRLARLQQPAGLSLQIILDICVVYGPKNPSKMKDFMEKAVKSNPNLLVEIQHVAVPSFASILLSGDSGLHALRKASSCLKYLLQSSPPSVLDQFLKDNEFVLALAKCYDARLSAIASGYGGMNIERVDDTETTTAWVGCKVALIDCFHVLLEHVLKGVHDDPRTNAERAFDLVFALINLPSASAQVTTPRTPFFNRSLIADYQDAYRLSSTLDSVLASNDDPRLDVLDATLKSFEAELSTGDKVGALKVILRSSGVPPGVDNRGTITKGKERAAPEPEPALNADLDAAVSSVLDILPDQEPAYIRQLLALPQYEGNVERVVAALLEGEAPTPSSLESEPETVQAPVHQIPLSERRNIFNEQPMEVANVHIGKQRGDADATLKDRSFLDQMKADILRRAAELSESEEEKEEDADDLESDLDGGVKVVADREDIEGETDEENESDDERRTLSRPKTPSQTPETMCELAYLKDPTVFDRDANTRRNSKARAELRTKTGWTDEQIEGWRIMLERNPNKDKILQKHEFAGNKKGPIPEHILAQTVRGSTRGRGYSRGRGRGRGGGGRGRGGSGGGSGAGDGSETRERAWKDKNKARQANHNRKRGHDRKMARGGGIPGPSS